MIRQEDFYIIGKINGPHGIGGEMDFHFTDNIFMDHDQCCLMCTIDGLMVPFFLEDWRQCTSNTAIIKFYHYDSAEAVSILQDATVYFNKAHATDEQRELASWQMLVGFSVSDKKAGLIGTVSSVNEMSCNTLLYIDTPSGQEVIIPIHPDFITMLDVNQRLLELSVPDGLLEINKNQ